jgi:8-hydroxy-5-deazaflavin:NADPH oxidoreductase
MTYSIIGSGNIGAALARQFGRAGVNVTIAKRRGADTLAPLVQELGSAIVAGTVEDAVQADIIFLALPSPPSKHSGALKINGAARSSSTRPTPMMFAPNFWPAACHRTSWRRHCRAPRW